jgi:uncharacterized membrane protein YoaK (UPF0700 family)
MKWSASVAQIDPPRPVGILLAIVAGFVDACTFLGLFGLFGLFVAQLTGSYVIAGSSLMTPGWPEATILLAVPLFFAAGVAATLVATTAAANGLPALACTLGLETALIAGFTALMVFGAPFPDPPPATAFAAALFGLAAMGVQSALVRLLLRGVASTNVMTTNTTQIAIEATQAALTWGLRRGGGPDMARQHEAACRRLAATVPLPLAFFAGTATGARLRRCRPVGAGAADRGGRGADAVGGAGGVERYPRRCSRANAASSSNRVGSRPRRARSISSRRSLVVTPPLAEKPPVLPPAATTRWHGTMTANGFRPSA